MLELSRNLQSEQSERQRMQDAVDVACVGLERESMALRAEVAAAVSANRVLQAQASYKTSPRKCKLIITSPSFHPAARQ